MRAGEREEQAEELSELSARAADWALVVLFRWPGTEHARSGRTSRPAADSEPFYCQVRIERVVSPMEPGKVKRLGDRAG